MPIYVEYHGDGGQACVLSREVVPSLDDAIKIGEWSDMIGGGHYCAKPTWGVFESDLELPCGHLDYHIAIETAWGTRWM